MNGFMDGIDFKQIIDIVDLGVAITMLSVFIRMYREKDKSKDQLQDKFVEVIKEVTQQGVDHTYTLERLSDAIENLHKTVDSKLADKDNSHGS